MGYSEFINYRVIRRLIGEGEWAEIKVEFKKFRKSVWIYAREIYHGHCLRAFETDREVQRKQKDLDVIFINLEKLMISWLRSCNGGF